MKDNDFNLPTPQMLVKKAKEETIPVSLRVKESTVAIFDKLAKEADVNRGVMMNTWLDFYAQNYDSSTHTLPDKDNAKDIMVSYLNSERFWKKTANLTTEDLIYKLVDTRNTNIGDIYSVKELLDYYNTGNSDEIGLPTAEIYQKDIEYQVSVEINKTAGFSSFDNYNFSIFVTPEQWPLVVTLLSEYTRKYEKLFPKQSISITIDVARRIAQACKQHNKPDSKLAAAIKDILLEFVEERND